MIGYKLGGVRIDFGMSKLILTIFVVVWFPIIKINYGLKIDSRRVLGCMLQPDTIDSEALESIVVFQQHIWLYILKINFCL